MEKVFRSCVIALVLTGISYFSGGVRFSFGSYTAPPLALQLAKNFIIFFIVLFLAFVLEEKIRKRRGK